MHLYHSLLSLEGGSQQHGNLKGHTGKIDPDKTAPQSLDNRKKTSSFHWTGFDLTNFVIFVIWTRNTYEHPPQKKNIVMSTEILSYTLSV